MLGIMQVISIVYNALNIAFVVAHFHFCFKNILHHDYYYNLGYIAFTPYVPFKYSYPILHLKHSRLSQYSFLSCINA